MKMILAFILAALAVASCKPSESARSKAQFVFVRIPEQVKPVDRGTKYEDPLDSVLKREAVGEVTGGGTQLSDPDNEGKRSIECVGIDVELSDFEKGMPILKRELLRLGAPPETILEYTRDGQKTEEKLE